MIQPLTLCPCVYGHYYYNMIYFILCCECTELWVWTRLCHLLNTTTALFPTMLLTKRWHSPATCPWVQLRKELGRERTHTLWRAYTHTCTHVSRHAHTHTHAHKHKHSHGKAGIWAVQQAERWEWKGSVIELMSAPLLRQRQSSGSG